MNLGRVNAVRTVGESLMSANVTIKADPTGFYFKSIEREDGWCLYTIIISDKEDSSDGAVINEIVRAYGAFED